MWLLKLRELLDREDSRSGKAASKGKTSAAEAESGRPAWVWPGICGAALLVLHLILFPPVPQLGVDFPQFGEIADRKVTAEFTFEAPRLDSEVQAERSRRALVEPPVLMSQTRTAGQSAEGRLEMWLVTLGDQVADDSLPVDEKIDLLHLQYPSLDPGALAWLFETEEPDSLLARMDRAGRAVLRGGVADMLPTGLYDKVVIKTPQAEYRKNLDEVVPQVRLEKQLEGQLRATGMKPADAARTANVMRNFITPNLTYSLEETQTNQERARQSVPNRREFYRGEKIIDQGERVTEEQALALDRLAELIRERGGRRQRGAHHQDLCPLSADHDGPGCFRLAGEYSFSR